MLLGSCKTGNLQTRTSSTATGKCARTIVTLLSSRWKRDVKERYQAYDPALVDLRGHAERSRLHAVRLNRAECELWCWSDVPRLYGEETRVRLIQGLAQYYRVSGYKPPRDLAPKLTGYARYHAQYYEPNGPPLVGPDECVWFKASNIANVRKPVGTQSLFRGPTHRSRVGASPGGTIPHQTSYAERKQRRSSPTQRRSFCPLVDRQGLGRLVKGSYLFHTALLFRQFMPNALLVATYFGFPR
jgi:hypothetical protein